MIFRERKTAVFGVHSHSTFNLFQFSFSYSYTQEQQQQILLIGLLIIIINTIHTFTHIPFTFVCFYTIHTTNIYYYYHNHKLSIHRTSLYHLLAYDLIISIIFFVLILPLLFLQTKN